MINHEPNKTKEIRPHMMVHAKGPGQMDGVEGVHVGSVDHLDGSYIKLTRKDSPDTKHHLIPTSWVQDIDTERNTIFLNVDADTVAREWLTAEDEEPTD